MREAGHPIPRTGLSVDENLPSMYSARKTFV